MAEVRYTPARCALLQAIADGAVRSTRFSSADAWWDRGPGVTPREKTVTAAVKVFRAAGLSKQRLGVIVARSYVEVLTDAGEALLAEWRRAHPA